MRFHRLPVKDPRTVARDIPGVCDLLFPQLLPSIITYLNRQSKRISNCEPVSAETINSTSINAAMLFEVANARTEQFLNGEFIENWELYLETALKRQSRYFDAELPKQLTENDLNAARATSQNLISRPSGARDTGKSSSRAISGNPWLSMDFTRAWGFFHR